MIKEVEKIHLFNGTSKFSSWLITIGTNLFIDQQRKAKRMNQALPLIRQLKWKMESQNEEWLDAMAALFKLPEEPEGSHCTEALSRI
ncbi:sigma factor [Jeotgalibacillus soli]|uniref:RNA polymerase sigma factor SigY n=1 Tax=Jeotgalibacillus soli TaxID=889306 RepID=A0A0C2R911_9BACL|nr:RNA polymerase sigma factor SigY [Jeotgalibacillus soli]